MKTWLSGGDYNDWLKMLSLRTKVKSSIITLSGFSLNDGQVCTATFDNGRVVNPELLPEGDTVFFTGGITAWGFVINKMKKENNPVPESTPAENYIEVRLTLSERDLVAQILDSEDRSLKVTINRDYSVAIEAANDAVVNMRERIRAIISRMYDNVTITIPANKTVITAPLELYE